MSSTVRTRLSHETLKWARAASGFEPDEVAKSAGVSLQRYKEWETGDDRPTFRQLRQVANKLKRPLAMFYLRKPPVEPALPPDFRVVPGKEDSSYSPELRLEIRKAERMQLLLACLVEELNLSQPKDVPRIRVEDDPESAGGLLRSFLGLSVEQQLSVGEPAALYREWRDAIFSRGVVPIQFGVEREQALGFALWHDFAPLVAVNTRQAAEAKTFTLLHELAHIALRMPGVSDAAIPFRQVSDGSRSEIEAFCNRVAAATLLPADSDALKATMSALTQTAKLDLASFRLQARRYGVSKYALAYRLSSLNPDLGSGVQAAVSQWFAIDNAKKPAPTVKKGGPPPALITLGRRGRGFSKAVLSAVRESRLSVDDARDLLDLEPHHFPKLEEYVFKGTPDEEGEE
ncbi:MAG: ImmA/IrrE family metallo-endopeptidase [Armatimonadetes bacterium]|nr:ImmA/IrrE family metallo-endopeptidase [Armatimonadota bacterium]